MDTTAGRSVSLRSRYGAGKSGVALVTLYIALFDGDPGGIGVEPTSTGSYARVAKTNDATLWGTIAAGDVSAVNVGVSGAIEFPTATALYSTNTLTHFGIYDNAAGGALHTYGELTTPIVITGAGDTPRIPQGALSITQLA